MVHAASVSTDPSNAVKRQEVLAAAATPENASPFINEASDADRQKSSHNTDASNSSQEASSGLGKEISITTNIAFASPSPPVVNTLEGEVRQAPDTMGLNLARSPLITFPNHRFDLFPLSQPQFVYLTIIHSAPLETLLLLRPRVPIQRVRS